jgi:plastocyanin
MPKRALIALATFALAATACISSTTPPVAYGTGPRFVPFVVDSIDDMGQGDSVGLTADGVPYVSYFGFPAKLAKGEIATPRPFGSPTVPGVMVSTASTDGLWQRGAVEMMAPDPLLKPVGVATPFGPIETEDLNLKPDNTNGTSVAVTDAGDVHVAWTAANEVKYATSTVAGPATVDVVFTLGHAVGTAGPIGRPGIALDDAGDPWIAFTVETSKGLQVHAVHQNGKSWEDTVVSTFPSCGGCPAPQPTGIGLVGGSAVVAYADPAANEVRAATLGAGGWSEAIVADGVSGFGLSFSVGTDTAYAAYYTGSGTVEEATWKSGAWTTDQVADAQDPALSTSGDAAWNTAVAAADDGTVYVGWEDDGIQLASGTGPFESVDIGTTARSGADPALDASAGGVALGWYDTAGQNQMLGLLNDEAEILVAQPSPSLVVSPAAAGGEECGKDGKVALDETALGSAFQQTCLVAPADDAFTINFDNQDAGTQHNVAIFTDSSATKNLFRGDIVTGVAQVPYDVKPLAAGSYYFHCDIHPTTMTGTLAVVKGAK